MENKIQPFHLGKPYDSTKILIVGFYGKYVTSVEKSTAYLKFLKSEKGKQWKSDCFIERNNFERNRRENKKDYGLRAKE